MIDAWNSLSVSAGNKNVGVAGGKTATKKFLVAFIGGVPLSETETEKRFVESDSEITGRHEIRPLLGSMTASVGDVAKVQVNDCVGESESDAELVMNNVCPAITLKLGIAVTTGGWLAGKRTP